jgi:hypothetical protein
MTSSRKRKMAKGKAGKLSLKKETLKDLSARDGAAGGVKGGLRGTSVNNIPCANTVICPVSQAATQLNCCLVKP